MNETYHCPVETALRLIGVKYKALILWHLLDRVLRFHELQRLIPRATPKMLTQQLREMEADGLVTRTVYPVVPPKVEYAPTALGLSVRPTLMAMYALGKEVLKSNGETPNCSMVYVPGESTECERCDGGCHADHGSTMRK